MSTTTETLYTPLTVAAAPEAARPMLEKVQKSLGFIPNLMATFGTGGPKSMFHIVGRWCVKPIYCICFFNLPKKERA